MRSLALPLFQSAATSVPGIEIFSRISLLAAPEGSSRELPPHDLSGIGDNAREQSAPKPDLSRAIKTLADVVD